jgi:hypothetical protein
MNLGLVMKLIYIHYWEYEMMEAFLVVRNELGTRQEAYIHTLLGIRDDGGIPCDKE